MGANMRPDSSAIYTWAAVDVRKSKQAILAKINEGDTTRNWNKIKQLYGLLADQPYLLEDELAKITASVLVIAGDKDIIREEHTVELFQAIPNAQLCIMPGETHYTPASNPDLFNSIVQKFIAEPFVRPDSDWTKW